MHKSLRKFTQSYLSGRKNNHTLHSRSGGISRGRSRSISRRSTDYRFGTFLLCFGNCHCHSAVFKRTGRVHTFKLQIKLNIFTDLSFKILPFPYAAPGFFLWWRKVYLFQQGPFSSLSLLPHEWL